ncbi:glycoside hydrolase family 27 protein [Arthrobacter sp. ISL-72]|uniref:glycoside hydrolase family 27 protein n=1 Tax=Arthrobacter sp. ISL-72 TaxID=2819114 RepID=UPI001BEB9023|nr:glycoside hydrolase family 27 protein [Arthrobacter sp. ISL-72]MBT2594030.1 glycoside hydrolase family 27 protein [Arthrobacter sp. ISL-72]
MNQLSLDGASHREKPPLALTPPLGWNSWNCFRCYDINESKLLEVADALVDSGMLQAGYDTFVIDDCWQAYARGSDGRLKAHPRRFPSGMQALGAELKSRGFKFGLYGSPGRKTCAMIYDRYPGRGLGSYGREDLDAETFAAWGVDFLKYDWCEADEDGTDLKYPDAFERMALALEATGRPIVYSISEYGRTQPWAWAGEYGHMWRTTPDIEKNWASVVSIGETHAKISNHSGPGGWNDADMLQVGNPGLSSDEAATHFALWCFFAAPLMAGNDPRTMGEDIRKLLTNQRLLRINQDPLGIAASCAEIAPGVDLWTRPLVQGEAWLIVNKSEHPIDIEYRSGAISFDRRLIAPVPAQAQILPLYGESPAAISERSVWSIPSHGCLPISCREDK